MWPEPHRAERDAIADALADRREQRELRRTPDPTAHRRRCFTGLVVWVVVLAAYILWHKLQTLAHL